MNSPVPEIAADAAWPSRLAGAFARLRRETEAEPWREAREDLWVLLYFGMMRCLRAVASRRGNYQRFDLEDVASKKSLEILRQAESGRTDLSQKTPREMVAFLSAVARHGLLDLRRARAQASEIGWPDGEEQTLERPGRPPAGPGASDPAQAVEARDFAAALRSCAEELPPRSLRIWFFRVFLEMSSREISDHPEVGLNPGHVDVLLQRIRASLESCMEKKGQRWRELPPGTFALLWEVMRVRTGVGSPSTASPL